MLTLISKPVGEPPEADESPRLPASDPLLGESSGVPINNLALAIALGSFVPGFTPVNGLEANVLANFAAAASSSLRI